jgi:hypothetical protein
MRKRNSRLKMAVRRAVVEHGGRLTTAEAAAVGYSHILEAGKKLNKCQYLYVRRALAEVAVRVGRTDDHPGRPWIWRAKDTATLRDASTLRGTNA